MQAGDTVIGLIAGEPGMAAGALIATIIAPGSWWWLRRTVVDATLAGVDAG